MRHLKFLLPFLLFFISGQAHADALVLVHGYFSDYKTWIKKGVTLELEKSGWKNGGLFVATPRGEIETRYTTPPSQKTYYLTDLPSEAPIALQSRLLKEIIVTLNKRHNRENLTLVGHSAGGVVARLFMVQNPKIKIQGLITIASPHLGTESAEAAHLIASSPLSMVTPFMGAGTLNRSQQLYRDLVRERPGTLLYWLNRQPHPKAHYVSLVRQQGISLLADNTVPAWSQSMQNVPVLKEKSTSITTNADHSLEQKDGEIITKLVHQWSETKPIRH